MNIGIVLGRKSSYGMNPKCKMDDFGYGYKKICELLFPHNVYLLSEFVFRDNETLPGHVHYCPEAKAGELELDIILFGRLNANLLFNGNLFRLLYVLLTFNQEVSLEMRIDTDAGFAFEKINIIENNRLFNREKLNMDIVSEYDKQWCDTVLDYNYTTEKFPVKYKSIYNAFCSNDENLAFPFSMLSWGYIKEWKPIETKIKEALVYVGNWKPRCKKLLEIGLATEMYGTESGIKPKLKKYPNLTYKGKCKMVDIPNLISASPCSIITYDDEHKNRGWVLNRFLESIACGVPCFFEKDFFPSNNKLYHANINHLSFNMPIDDLQIVIELMIKCQNIRREIVNIQLNVFNDVYKLITNNFLTYFVSYILEEAYVQSR